MNIYVDFNGTEVCTFAENELCLDLTGYGTLASLSFYGIRLTEGREIILVDPDGLTVSAKVYFDKERISNNSSGWFARFKKDDMWDGLPVKHDYHTHLCFNCRKNVKPHLKKVGQNFAEACPFCGTPIMFPLLPPKN